MARRFDLFLVLAEMRTGSNLLESSLNAWPGLTCHGELFNPHFMGSHNRFDFDGITMQERAADPGQVLARLRAGEGLQGFRYFHDHDPRVLAQLLPDPRCAKVVLTRNPVESFVSLQIARATDQWRLTDHSRLKSAPVSFDPVAFEAHLERLQAFQIEVLRGLQTTGQTAFYIAYEDLGDIEVLNGLARFLGADTTLDSIETRLKKQNPEPLTEKVTNPDEMEQALARLDRFNLSRTPNFEPRRGPGVPGFFAAQAAGLLCMPVQGGPVQRLRDWFSALEDGGALVEGFTQKTLADWMRDNPGHRRICVVRHPLARAWTVFHDAILSGRFAGIRSALQRGYGLALPAPEDRAGYHHEALRQDFLGFLKFVRGNLAGQSSLRVDPLWASQGAILRGFAEIALPHRVLREQDMEGELPNLLPGGVPGRSCAVPPGPDLPPGLDALCDDEVQRAARAAYARDFVEFGFADWQPGSAASSGARV